MISSSLLLTLLLAAGTFAVRYTGVALGQRLPQSGPWTRALNALPGCLIVSLVAVLLASGGMVEVIGAAVALATALLTRNLPLTMAAGIVTVWLVRLAA